MKKQATAEEKTRMEKLKEMGCIVTRLTHGAYADADVHHLTDCGRRRGHMYTIPLSPWYHRAVPLPGFTPATMREIYGPSLAESKKDFEAAYGTELELLDKVNKWLGCKSKTA